MRIGELARRYGIATSKIRFLESRGLLRSRRLGSGYRDYDDATADLLGLVLEAQSFGFTLDEIATAFAESRGKKPTCEALLPKLTKRLAQLDRHIEQTRALRTRVAAMHRHLQSRIESRRAS